MTLKDEIGAEQEAYRAYFRGEESNPPDQDPDGLFPSAGPEPTGTTAAHLKARLLAMQDLERCRDAGIPQSVEAFEAALVLAVRLGRALGEDKWREGTRDRLRVGQRQASASLAGILAIQAKLDPFREEVKRYALENPRMTKRRIAVHFLPEDQRQDKLKIDSMRQKVDAALAK